MKSTNRGLVLQYLATSRHPLTRGELTAQTGLSKMTVSNIVNEFLSQDMVTEKPKNPDLPISRSNPMLLNISPNAPKIIGIRIRHHSCMATLSNLKMETLNTRRVSLENGLPGAQLLEIIQELIAPYLRENRILGIGIGSIGPVVDSQQGIVLFPSEHMGFNSLAICKYLEDYSNVPVFVEHTSSCAIMAEQLYGSAGKYQDFTYFSMASSFNLGVITNGHLQSSRTGLSGEIAHICISMDGPQCYCGNRGCLEAFVNVEKLCKAAKDSPLIGEDLTFSQLCSRSDQPAVHHLLMHELIDYLVIAMTNIAHLLTPEAIYLGDELARLPGRYINYMEQVLNNRLFSRNYRYIKLLRATIPSEDTSAFCAISVLDHLFKNGSVRL